MSPKEREYAMRILSAAKKPKSSSELLALTDYKSKNSLMHNLIKPLLEAGLLECTEIE